MYLLEYWKRLEQFPNYEISYSLNVRHVTFRQNKKCYLDENGYLTMNLGNGKKRRLHQLSAQAFIPNPDQKPDVHHIDEDKLNNRPENLMWVTKEEHRAISIENGQMAMKLTTEDVVFIRKNYFLYGGDRLATMFNINTTTVFGIASGRTRTNIDYPCHFYHLGREKIILDINTGVFYESAQELSALIGMPRKEILRQLSNERANRTPYRFAEIDGYVDTPAPTKPARSKKMKPIAKFDESGREVERWMCISTIKPVVLRVRISKFLAGRSRSVDGYYYKLIDIDGKFIEPVPFISTAKPRIIRGAPTPKKQVVKYDLRGNIVEQFPSIFAAAKSVKQEARNFRKSINRSPTNFYKGFVYKIG